MDLPPHYSVTIKFKLFKIDSWNGQSLFVMVDGVSVRIITFNANSGTSDICGDPNPVIDAYTPGYNE